MTKLMTILAPNKIILQNATYQMFFFYQSSLLLSIIVKFGDCVCDVTISSFWLLWNHKKSCLFNFRGIRGKPSLQPNELLTSSTKTNFKRVIFLTESEKRRIREISSQQISKNKIKSTKLALTKLDDSTVYENQHCKCNEIEIAM